MGKMQLTVYIEQDEDGMIIASIPSILGCHAQGKTKQKMLENLTAVAKLCLRNLNKEDFYKTTFLGIDNLELINA